MANVLRQVKIDGRWRMLPVLKLADGRLDWTKVTFQGAAVVAEAGTFFLEYREEGRRVRRAVGQHMREAKAALATQTGVLKLRAEGVDVSDAPQIRQRPELQGRTIRSVVEAFTAAPPIGLRRRSVTAYQFALHEFLGLTRKTHIAQLGWEDVEAYMGHVVRGLGLAASTARDRGFIVATICNRAGAAIQVKKGAWPKVTQQEPEVYKPETLRALFQSLAGAGLVRRRDYILYQTFLLTGFREQEVMYLCWDDFDARHSTLSVTKKPGIGLGGHGFDPKTYRERTNPIPSLLVQLLEEHRTRRDPACELIFPTSASNRRQGRPGGQPDKHMLRRLKDLAFRAGLNCGRCVTRRADVRMTCATAAVCGKFGLHRFRHTYATTLLRDGLDIKNVQRLMGHTDIASTMRYLHAMGSDDLLRQISATSLATRFV
jgi:integrase/recombinase XerD